MREEKELLNKKLKLVDAKLKKVEDQVNRFSLALKDAKDDVVESFTKDFDAVKDQVLPSFIQGKNPRIQENQDIWSSWSLES